MCVTVPIQFAVRFFCLEFARSLSLQSLSFDMRKGNPSTNAGWVAHRQHIPREQTATTALMGGAHMCQRLELSWA
jgi:hypothetical protein